MQLNFFTMRIIRNQFQSLLLLLAMIVAVSACKNDDEPTPPAAVLSVTSFTPSSGPVGTKVTITGTNFSTTAASNTVLFNTVAATVTAATATSLEVTVPTGATTGVISVTSGGVTAKSTASYTVSETVKTAVEVKGNITTNTTWTADKVYTIKGFVYVQSGATLTIEKGTLIKGGAKEDDPSGQQQGGTLIINQGAKIMAVGTAEQPIVFTSSKEPGKRNYGDWGGVVLVGKAPHNQPGSKGPEGGISVPGGLGTDNISTDNSGTLQYVRIEFGGIALSNSANSEINGLTLYAVGSGTTIDHIQVSYSGDDSFEWFGGTVNAKNLIAFRGFDDDWDTDWGFTGKVQYALSLRDPKISDQSKSNGFESDNYDPGEPATGPNAGLPLTAPTFANVSNFVFNTAPSTDFVSPASGAYQAAMHLRRNTSISIFNSLFVGYPQGLRLEGTATGTYANATSGALDLKGIVLSNMTDPILGAGVITKDQAVAYFNTAARKNETKDMASLLLNSANFNLSAPGFLPQATSPLLAGAVWEGKAADGFFTKELFRGAFGTTDWTKTWTNFDPQNTIYK